MLWEGRRPRGGGFCGRPPRPGGGEEPHRAARVPGMGRCGAGPQPGQQIRDYGEAPEAPRPSPARPAGPGNGGDTHMAALGCADLALSVRSSLPGLVAPQLPLSPLPASAPPSARRLPPSHPAPLARWAPPTALPRLPHPRRRPRLAPPSRVTGQASGPRGPPVCGEAGPWRTRGRWEFSALRIRGNWAAASRPVPFLPTQIPKQGAPGSPACLPPSQNLWSLEIFQALLSVTA